MLTEPIRLSATIPDTLSGERLDRIAADLFPDYSRSALQEWIRKGQLTVNGKIAKPRDKHYAGATLKVDAQQEILGKDIAEDIPLDIVYEDDELLVINKSANQVVHPAAGNHSGTLLNALLHHHPAAATLPRAGIVHRLDKDTTGLMVVAKTLSTHHSLVKQLRDHLIKREYQAIVYGNMTSGGKVDQPIGRHPHHRTKMAVEPLHGKKAVTHYRIHQHFPGLTHLDLSLETGRTHQIRVHLSHLRHPIVGDVAYGGRTRLPEGAAPELVTALKSFPRQALHAYRLGLFQPASENWLEWEVDLPEDMQQLLAVIKQVPVSRSLVKSVATTPEIITPEWPAPAQIKTAITTRRGGVSQPPYDTFNLATHVEDNIKHVTENRRQLKARLKLANEPLWLNQTHSNIVIDAHQHAPGVEADACFSNAPNHVCAVLTADCLPILVCNKQGTWVQAIHAGWQGIAKRIIEQAIAAYAGDKSDLMAYLGPAIGSEFFEVRTDVLETCTADLSSAQKKMLIKKCFKPIAGKEGYFLADLYELGRQRLVKCGVKQVYGGNFCTHKDSERFFSYRRDGRGGTDKTGRIASLIWIAG